MALTDTALRNAKPKDKAYKLYDEKGLFLIVNPNGGKWWRFKYRFDDKEKTLSLGTYPEVPLAGRWNDPETKKDWIDGARDKRDQARELVANVIDPSDNRKAEKQAKAGDTLNSFETIAREWID